MVVIVCIYLLSIDLTHDFIAIFYKNIYRVCLQRTLTNTFIHNAHCTAHPLFGMVNRRIASKTFLKWLIKFDIK